MKRLDKDNADFIWGEGAAWILEEKVIVDIFNNEEAVMEGFINVMSYNEFEEHFGERIYAGEQPLIIEYGNITIDHTFNKNFKDGVFKAIDIIEGCFADEGSPGKLAERLYKINFSKGGLVSLKSGGISTVIHQFDGYKDYLTMFNHLINEAGKKYNLSADEIGEYSLAPDFEWEVMGYDTKIYPVSNEVWKLYQDLKENPIKGTDAFIMKEMDFKVKIYSEFMGTIELDMSERKDKIGFIYNMLSMIYGSKGSRPYIMKIHKKQDEDEWDNIDFDTEPETNNLISKGLDNLDIKELIRCAEKHIWKNGLKSQFLTKECIKELEKRLGIDYQKKNWWGDDFSRRLSKIKGEM